MIDPFDETVERALIQGFDVNEYLSSLTKQHPHLHAAAQREARAIEHMFAKEQEKRANEMVFKAERHLEECLAHRAECAERVLATAEEN